MTRYLTRNLEQTAVYWASPSPSGRGGYSYDDPVELDVRWEDKQEKFVDVNGQEMISGAIVIVDQDVDIGGILFLGDLDDLDSSEEASPGSVKQAWEIRKFEKTPNIKALGYYRKAYLTSMGG